MRSHWGSLTNCAFATPPTPGRARGWRRGRGLRCWPTTTQCSGNCGRGLGHRVECVLQLWTAGVQLERAVPCGHDKRCIASAWCEPPPMPLILPDCAAPATSAPLQPLGRMARWASRRPLGALEWWVSRLLLLIRPHCRHACKGTSRATNNPLAFTHCFTPLTPTAPGVQLCLPSHGPAVVRVGLIAGAVRPT